MAACSGHLITRYVSPSKVGLYTKPPLALLASDAGTIRKMRRNSSMCEFNLIEFHYTNFRHYLAKPFFFIRKTYFSLINFLFFPIFGLGPKNTHRRDLTLGPSKASASLSKPGLPLHPHKYLVCENKFFYAEKYAIPFWVFQI